MLIVSFHGFATYAAHAHVGDVIGSIDVVAPLAGDVAPSVEGTYGLLVNDGDAYRWVCHEAITQPKAVRAPEYDRSLDGSWLAALPSLEQGRDGRTLFHSPDGGCSWNDVSGVPVGTLVNEVAYAQHDALRAYAATATPKAANGVYGSTDGGATWTEAVPPTADRIFHGVAADGTHEWATATSEDGTRGYLWQRAGGDWVESQVPLPKGTTGAKLAVFGHRGTRLWLVVDPLGDDTLITTPDAGKTWQTLLEGAGEMNDGQIVGDSLYVVLGNGAELRRVYTDGTVSTPTGEFPPALGIAATDSALFVAELPYISGPMLGKADLDATAFEPVAYPDDVASPLDCPADTEVAQICVPLWDDLFPRIRGFDAPEIETGGDTATTDGAADTDGSGPCGCQPTPAPPIPAATALALLVLRRRR